MSQEPVDWEAAEDSFLVPSLAAGDATGWFDQLYTAAADGQVTMPWSRTEPQPLLVQWAHRAELRGTGQTAVVVGCALVADAEFVAGLGFTTTSRRPRSGWPGNAMRTPPSAMSVPTCCTCQPTGSAPSTWSSRSSRCRRCRPNSTRAAAAVRDLVADGGTLLVIGATPESDEAVPPWPLTRNEIGVLATDGLNAVAIEETAVPGKPTQLRWQDEYRRC